MRPVQFEHVTNQVAEKQDEYNTLPALILDTPEGDVISKWKLTFWERLRVLFLGYIWVDLWCFGKPVTPSRLTTYRKEVYSLPTDKEVKDAKQKNR